MANRTPFSPEILEQYPDALKKAREAALKCGYAIGVHGSQTYDLDLIAAPWIDECSSAEELALAITCALGWFLHPQRTSKPHGRIGFLIYGMKHAHIDLSVMPKHDKPS